MDSINKVNKLNKSDFISIFGNVFEKTEWIAERVFDYLPYKNFDNLRLKFFKIYNESNKESIIKILNSHPELVVEQKLTNESKKEQKGAGLNECSKEEVEEFKKLNLNYKKKFGFPFIIAVKGKNKNDILNYFRTRIKNSFDEEFIEAKKQVGEIATFRFKEIIK
jgi:OHCU decarboxylase|tara:strand:- start:2458 stop:2952 length:495 start_codon:yes stop_codon:yes gene_type:complete